MLRRVYIEQFDGWWSFTPEQWLDLVTTTLLDWEPDGSVGYTLPDECQLANRPKTVKSYSFGDGHIGYYSTTPAIRVVQPLSWHRAEFDDEQTEMQQLILHLKRQEDH